VRTTIEEQVLAIKGLSVLAADPEWSKVQEAFPRVARYMFTTLDGAVFSELMIAPDAVIGAVYPEGPASLSIGFDLWDHPNPRGSVRYARETRQWAMQGPITLTRRSQDRPALVFRYPVWADEVPGMLTDGERGSWTGAKWWEFEPPAYPGGPRTLFWGIAVALLWWDELSKDLLKYMALGSQDER